MKPKDIQRSVQNRQHDRAPGDAPSLGRVSRMPGTGLASQTRRRRRRGESRPQSRLPESGKKLLKIRILILSGFGLLFLSILAMLGFRGGRTDDASGSTQAKENEVVRVASAFPSPSKEDALRFVEKALAVREPAQVPEFFRAMENRDQEVVDFLAGMAARDGVITEYQWMSSIDANRLSLDGVNVIFKGKDRIENRLALLTPDAAGVWKMDFDAFARTVQPRWKQILSPETQVAVVRVFVAKDGYFNGPFRDEKVWNCYGMASADNEEGLLGYAKIGSAQDAALRAILAHGGRLKRATLEIRRLASGEVRQFEISKVIAEDWVLADEPFQANFADGQSRLPDPVW
jgi:hypothetical protein